jgi:hypothetical protein
MVRRRVAAGIALVIVIVIVFVISGCLKSQKQQSLKDYNQKVSAIAQESESQVAQPLFSALATAAGKPALSVGVQIDQFRVQAQSILSQARALSVPSEMTNAQRDLLLTLDLRLEGMTKLAALLPAALGGQAQQSSAKIAGDMGIFLASDVIYSQRVVPLIQQTLSSNGIHELNTAPSHFLTNVGWLEPSTVTSRLTGQPSGSPASQTVTGNHGHALISTSVGTQKLEPEPTINHVTGGGNPTFTLVVENSGEFPETNVKADITVTAGGKQFKASHVINQTLPGQKVNVEIPVSGTPLGVAAKIEAYVEGVPGENDLENNKGTYLAIFSP